MDKPLVSILTPCYNMEKYLERFLAKFLCQTYDRAELVLVDDGSTDQTAAVAERFRPLFAERGFLFTFIRQENGGLGAAISTALRNMHGDYFAWCDADNFYDDTYMEKKVAFFGEHPEYSVVRCDGYIVYDDDVETPIGRMADGNTEKCKEKLFENALMEQNFHFGCAMIRTADFDRVCPGRSIYPSRHGQNWQLLLPVFYHGLSGYIDEPLFFFVFRRDSLSHGMHGDAEKEREQFFAYEDILLNTLSDMHIPDEKKYRDAVRIKYSRQRLLLAYRQGQRTDFTAEWNILKPLGALHPKDYIRRLLLSVPSFTRLYRTCRYKNQADKR